MSSSTAIRFDLPDGAKAKTYAPSVVSVKDSAMEGTTYQDGSSDSEQPLREIAGKESHQVHRLRIVVLLVLLLAAVAVSSAIFLLTKQSEEEEFETEFNGIAAKVLESKLWVKRSRRWIPWQLPPLPLHLLTTCLGPL